jgi:hypothetical protein
MTGRHAAADDIDDEALADELREPGAHRADGDPAVAPADPQGEIGDGSVPADADLKPEAAPEAAAKPSTRSGRRAATPKGSPS